MGCKNSSAANVYVNGRPTFKGDTVTPGFKEKGNGLLFRIVKKKKEWAFYNDTTDYEFHVTVTFNEDCNIEALGKTTLEQKEDGKWVARVVVFPTETAMFISGRVNGFTSKMDAHDVSEEGKAFYEKNKEAMAALMADSKEKA